MFIYTKYILTNAYVVCVWNIFDTLL